MVSSHFKNTTYHHYAVFCLFNVIDMIMKKNDATRLVIVIISVILLIFSLNTQEQPLNYGDISTQNTIAIIDTGINEKYLNDVTIISENNFDEEGHGTEMFLIAQKISPNSKKLIYDVSDRNNQITPKEVAKAIYTSVNNGSKIINISLGTYIISGEIEKAIDYAQEKKVYVFAAAGDYGDIVLLYPASNPYVISVGAVDYNGNIWYRQNKQLETDLNLPGVDLLVNGKNDSGTSYATIIASSIFSLSELTQENLDKLIKISKIEVFSKYYFMY